MIRTTLAAALALLLTASPAIAQSQQEVLDARYNRALAAGYKALFLCSAIANAERNGATRSPENVMQWELTGIQSPLDSIVGELGYAIIRHDNGTVERVNVEWADDMPPRIAIHMDTGGCSLTPLGGSGDMYGRPMQESGTRKVDHEAVARPGGPLKPVIEASLAEDYGIGSRTTAVLVTKGAQPLGEAYAEGFGPATPQRTWSVAKSIAATIIGAAVQRGDATTSQSADLGFSGGEPRKKVTIDHALRMASGRYSSTPGNRTDALYFGGSGVMETALSWPLVHPPGTVYRYANNDTLAAQQAISATFRDHPPASVLSRIGMTQTVAEHDWRRQYILSSQVWSTARDLAKLGQLYLDDGILPDGTRLLPEGWVKYVAAPSGPQPDGPFGYGAGFWLLNTSEGIPADTFAAMGNRGQYVVIVPSRDIIIVRRGEDPAGSRFDIAAFTRDVLAALK